MKCKKKSTLINLILIIMLIMCLILSALLIIVSISKEKIVKKNGNEISNGYITTEDANNTWDVSANGDGTVIATLVEDGTLTISGTGEMKSWSYDDTRDWRGNKEQVKKVIIQDGVTSIGKEAFYGCVNLEIVEISSTVITIGDGAFCGCSKLATFDIPEGTITIGNYAFASCTSLKDINIANTIKNIGDGAFGGCTSLTSVEIPSGITSIEYNVFLGCTNLTNIKLPNGLTTIKDTAFMSCSSLTTIEIPRTVTSIGFYVFDYCTSLVNIEVDENNAYYADIDGVLYTKDKTEIIKCPEGKIDNKYTILNDVTRIHSNAFFRCNAFEWIEIPSTVSDIGANAFNECSRLTNIKVDENNEYYMDDNGVLYTKDKTKIIKYPEEKKDSEYTILSGVTKIVVNAFARCTYLENIKIPSGVITIEDSAFSECSNLKNIEIPEGVSTIGFSAFDNCTNLEKVELPESLTTINANLFHGCSSLINIDLPKGIKYIDTCAFSTCTSLESIIIPEGVIKIAEDAFYRCSSLTNVEFPNSLTIIGSFAFTNCGNLRSIKIPEGVTTIGEYAFYGCNNLTSIDIPSSVKEIGNYAFVSNIKKFITKEEKEIALPEVFIRAQTKEDILYSNEEFELTNCTIEGTKIKINNDVAYACVNIVEGCLNGLRYEIFYESWDISKDETNQVIAELTEDGTLTITGKGEMDAYKNGFVAWEFLKPKIKKVSIQEGVTKIPSGIFAYSENLNVVEIPSSIITIEDNPFKDCSKLTQINVNSNNTQYKAEDGILYTKDGTEIVIYSAGKVESEYSIKEGITRIGEEAFCGCRNLKTIIIPESVTDIGFAAFEFCSNLETIKISNGITKMPDCIFAYCTNLKNIELPDKITSIGRSAFFVCNNLEKIEIPNSVTIIEYGAFYDCTKLTSVNIPNKLTYIEESLFNRCISLTNLIISNNVTYIGANAFAECNNLTITCKSGSPVEAYAKQNNIKYQLDEEIPEIQMIGDWTSELVKEESAIVSVMDNFTGVEEDSLRYLWSTESENVTKDKITNKFTNGESLKIKDSTGIYYLWIYAEDKVGNETIERSIGFNLDNSGPTLEVNYSTLEPTNQNIIVTIKSNERIQEVEGWNLSSNGQELTKEYAENTLENGETIIVKDMLENEATVNIKIMNIDRVAPILTLNAEPISNTIEVEIQALDDKSGINENSYKYYIKDENSSYGEAIDAESIHVFTDLKYETKYYIKVEVADNAGNMVEKEIEVITPKSDKITSTTQKVDEEKKTIKEIRSKTTVKEIKQNLQNDMNYKIYDQKGNIVLENEKIGTGYKIKMENEKTYTLVVTGDSTGDGEADIKDILAINKHRLNKANLVEEFLEAADINGDGKSDIKDILQINKFRLGKINEL